MIYNIFRFFTRLILINHKITFQVLSFWTFFNLLDDLRFYLNIISSLYHMVICQYWFIFYGSIFHKIGPQYFHKYYSTIKNTFDLIYHNFRFLYEVDSILCNINKTNAILAFLFKYIAIWLNHKNTCQSKHNRAIWLTHNNIVHIKTPDTSCFWQSWFITWQKLCIITISQVVSQPHVK